MANKEKDLSLLIHSLTGTAKNPPNPTKVQQQSHNERPVHKPNNAGGGKK